jgi:hypothetical protein
VNPRGVWMSSLSAFSPRSQSNREQLAVLYHLRPSSGTGRRLDPQPGTREHAAPVTPSLPKRWSVRHATRRATPCDGRLGGSWAAAGSPRPRRSTRSCRRPNYTSAARTHVGGCAGLSTRTSSKTTSYPPPEWAKCPDKSKTHGQRLCSSTEAINLDTQYTVLKNF